MPAMSGGRETLADGADALPALRRWEAAGAGWVLRAVADGRAVVDLLTCDGGDVVGRLASDDPAFLDYVSAAAPSGG